MTVDPKAPVVYGWRYVQRTLSDGRTKLDQVPLTLEDVLHPLEDDVIPEIPYHQIDRGYLASVVRTCLPRLNRGVVFSDCLIAWGVEGIKNHSPDISVFENLCREPDLHKGIFEVVAYGARCLLAVEVVSPHTRTIDVDAKFREYHAVGVPLYVLVDQVREGGPREVLGYEHSPKGYVPVPLDSRGRLVIGTLGLCLGLKDNKVVCYDTSSGEEFGDYGAVCQAIKAFEEEAVRQAAARALLEKETREIEAATCRAREATRLAREGKRQAEEDAKRHTVARLAAEENTRQLREATTNLEQQFQAMEAELRRLRGELPS